MASLGGSGFRELARLNYDKAEYLKKALRQAGFYLPFSQPTFNEFVVEFPTGFEKTYQGLLQKKIIAGLPLADYYPELKNHYLICVTETMSRDDMDALVKEISQ
jgi:glycine dehydrogenase subunit 1